MGLSQHLTTQLKGTERLVDGETGAILLRNPILRGLPALGVQGGGFTLEFIVPTLLCLNDQEPSGVARLLAEGQKAQLPDLVDIYSRYS
jgi:hypothetical protein